MKIVVTTTADCDPPPLDRTIEDLRDRASDFEDVLAELLLDEQVAFSIYSIVRVEL